MSRALPALTLTLALTLPLPAADWPRFHGANGAGVADANTPVDFSKGSGWAVPIPGSGHSSPVVVGGRVHLQSASADGGKRMLLCLDAATGETKWTREAAGSRGHTHKKNSLASSTPAVDDGRVFAVFWDGRGCSLHAYDLDGTPLWDKPLGPFESDHGAGLSPVAANGKVFINYDQGAEKDRPGKAEVFAFDAKTGAKVWSAPRKGFRACSASPVLRTLPNGKGELVVASTAGVTGYDPDKGTVNWDWVWKFDGMPLRTIATPLIVNGVVVAFAGDGGGSRSTVAIAPGKTPKLLWEKRKACPYVPSPVAKGDHLYWVTDDGQASCAAVKTGKVEWTERVFAKGVTASVLLAGDKVLAVAEDGKAVAFKADPAGFNEVSTGSIGESVFASPAAAGGRLFVRGFDHLFCFAGK